MNSKSFNLIVRIVIAVVIGIFLVRYIGFSPVLPIVGVIYGFLLFLLFGLPLIRRAGDRVSKLFWPDDSHFRIVPEYSRAEARAKEGRYPEAVDEYRQVIAEHPDDIYPHLRIAELALDHLHDVKLAELELRSAVAKATGPDSTALAANRLADLYQHALHDPARALEVVKQLRERLPGTKQARLAEERIVLLDKLARGAVSPPQVPDKISLRPSRYKMPE
ncbi:MAG TPA: hypothetical protein VL486_12130 [Verrucomicrobiae bacterium]|nr:hypothetical protein [Verrucomicrobiae bacterium]